MLKSNLRTRNAEKWRAQQTAQQAENKKANQERLNNRERGGPYTKGRDGDKGKGKGKGDKGKGKGNQIHYDGFGKLLLIYRVEFCKTLHFKTKKSLKSVNF